MVEPIVFDLFSDFIKSCDTSDDAELFADAHINPYKLYDTAEFKRRYTYDGPLGARWTTQKTEFTVWAPLYSSVNVAIYNAGDGDETPVEYVMEKGEKGEWTATVTGNLDGKYYTYKLIDKHGNVKEIVDPYARSAGRNGKRGMILDLASTDPDGWKTHSRPAARGSYCNAVIYEAHIRDLTIHSSSNVSAPNRGKFLGLTEKASEANGNKKTPLDYIRELGVTELHILPMFDFATVKEDFSYATYNKECEYNWGYDPLNYNVPEGSYSSNPIDGKVRVNELKKMIMALHEAGIRVIMDVVYNHVHDAAGSNFEALAPGYFFRTHNDGTLKNASGCGNDTASERAMYRKFMIDSVSYWADEYKIDGFRFDLMGLHDAVTINKIYDTLALSNPDIMIYGEGWVMDSLVETDDMKAANMYNAALMPNIAFFDDATRDTLRGGGFGQPITVPGFIAGNKNNPAVYMGAAGGTCNNAAGYGKTGKRPFAVSPTQNVNYVSCHDNPTLWDKINASTPGVDESTRRAMNRLAAVAVLTSQGPSFFLAGEEMLRSKPTAEHNSYNNNPERWADSDYCFAENSYMSPDSVNAMDWGLCQTNSDMVEFYKQLIALKKNSPMFRIPDKAELDECLKIADTRFDDGIAAYAVKDAGSDEYAVVLFNATAAAADVPIPQGEYKVYVNGAKANAVTALSSFVGDKFTVGAFSAVVMKGVTGDNSITAWIKLSGIVSGR